MLYEADASIGAGEAPVEIVRRADVGLAVVTEQRLVALLVAPMGMGLIGSLGDGHLVVDRRAPARRDGMMATAGIGVVLGQYDAVAADLVDGADMRAVRSDDVHMLGNPVKRTALGLAFGAPRADLALEAGTVLAAIFVIIAVERGDLAAPPAVIILVAT